MQPLYGKPIFTIYLLKIVLYMLLPICLLASQADTIPYAYAALSQQNRAASHCEDRFYVTCTQEPATAFFAVLDGHGGDGCVRYAVRGSQILARYAHSSKEVPEILKTIDQMFLQRSMTKNRQLADRSGSTFVGLWLSHKKAHLFNVGDSGACILCPDGHLLPLKRGKKRIFRTRPHTVYDPREKKRVQRAGGIIYKREAAHYIGTTSSRLLQPSRTLGDFEFKQPFTKKNIVSAEPDVYTVNIPRGGCIIILFSGGVSDLITPEQLAHGMHKCLRWDQLKSGNHHANHTTDMSPTWSGGNCEELQTIAQRIIGDSNPEEDTTVMLIYVNGPGL